MRIFASLVAATAVLTGCALRVPVAVESPSASHASRAKSVDYYRSLPEAAPGKEYLAALQKAIAPHKDLGYDGARDVMFSDLDDVNNQDTIVDVYSGRTLKGVTDTKTAFNRGLNAEHSWPQSMGAVGPAKDDLHHLYPVDCGANSTRSNYPLGEVTAPIEILPDFNGDGDHSRLGTNAAGITVFEPRKGHKGDVARALFYFYVCYGNFKGGAPGINVANFKIEHDVLLKWHEQDPVSPAETRRNNEIYKVQGNRNPFIDHPDWVRRIGRFI